MRKTCGSTSAMPSHLLVKSVRFSIRRAPRVALPSTPALSAKADIRPGTLPHPLGGGNPCEDAAATDGLVFSRPQDGGGPGWGLTYPREDWSRRSGQLLALIGRFEAAQDGVA